MNDTPVVIAGGGMAGLALALLLRRHGMGPVTVVEAAPLAGGGKDPDTPSFDARKTALTAGSLGILASLGLEQRLLARAAPIREVHVSRRGRPGRVCLRARDEGVARLGAVLENRRLGGVLLEAVAADPAIRLHAPARLAGVARQTGGYRVRLEDDTIIDCGLLVAADGARSRTRDWLGISARHHDSGEDALVTNVQLDRPHEGIARQRFTDRGTLALLPMTEQRMALVWSAPREEVTGLAECGDAELAARVAEQFGAAPGTMTRIGERQRYPLIFTRACGQVVPQGVVVGNAAHTLHPVAAQGFNLTLRDLAGLASTLEGRDKPGDLALLQRWYESRQADQALVERFSGSLPELFRVTFPPVAHARQLGLMALDSLPGLRHRFARRAMGL